ncbi:hypothetical protein DPEC_G00163210 [Dallia pectoralis]|uniref:Uncharacterized protein n=1 Tax=Dallia pectoralis TaxID=75939 RepID=A0ACC2GGY4_DALPE|nr:hypothetical protein DPEC_G00163210 [Dallia pectoralis]
MLESGCCSETKARIFKALLRHWLGCDSEAREYMWNAVDPFLNGNLLPEDLKLVPSCTTTVRSSEKSPLQETQQVFQEVSRPSENPCEPMTPSQFQDWRNSLCKCSAPNQDSLKLKGCNQSPSSDTKEFPGPDLGSALHQETQPQENPVGSVDYPTEHQDSTQRVLVQAEGLLLGSQDLHYNDTYIFSSVDQGPSAHPAWDLTRCRDVLPTSPESREDPSLTRDSIHDRNPDDDPKQPLGSRQRQEPVLGVSPDQGNGTEEARVDKEAGGKARRILPVVTVLTQEDVVSLTTSPSHAAKLKEHLNQIDFTDRNYKDPSLSDGRDLLAFCDLLSLKSDTVSLSRSDADGQEEDTRSVAASSVMSVFPRIPLDPMEKEWLRFCALGNTSALKQLLTQDPSLAAKKALSSPLHSVGSQTALHWAAKQGRTETVDMMACAAVDVNVRSVSDRRGDGCRRTVRVDEFTVHTASLLL